MRRDLGTSAVVLEAHNVRPRDPFLARSNHAARFHDASTKWSFDRLAFTDHARLCVHAGITDCTPT
jgi:hypothetical protein